VPVLVVLRYTVYPVASVTAVQLTAILLVEAAVALTPVGATMVPPPLQFVVAEAVVERVLSP
jgi:hypothetical protein